MHSLHYLLALISLAASAPSLAPRACNTGAPGGVYTCPYNNFRDFTSSGHYMYVCKWWAPGSQDCFSWDGQYLSEMPQAIGPDGGGYCVFYKEENCKGEMVRWADGKRVESGGSERLECPGIPDTRAPDWYKSFKCRAY